MPHVLDLPCELNPQQAEAVAHAPDAGPLLVIAGAGSGKTLTLAARLAWLVRCGADPNRTLLLTFSRRAAGEMARRAGRLLHEALRLPPQSPPPVLPWCGTFHSVAARLLREEAPLIGLPPGFTVLDRPDAQDLLAIARQQLGLAADEGETPGRRRFPLAPTCAAIHSRQVNTGEPLSGLLAAQWPWCRDHEAALQRAGVNVVFLAYGDAESNRELADDAGLESPVLLLGDEAGPFGSSGTPSAYHLDRDGRIAVQSALASQLAGIDQRKAFLQFPFRPHKGDHQAQIGAGLPDPGQRPTFQRE